MPYPVPPPPELPAIVHHVSQLSASDAAPLQATFTQLATEIPSPLESFNSGQPDPASEVQEAIAIAPVPSPPERFDNPQNLSDRPAALLGEPLAISTQSHSPWDGAPESEIVFEPISAEIFKQPVAQTSEPPPGEVLEIPETAPPGEVLEIPEAAPPAPIPPETPPVPPLPTGTGGIIELIADRQEFDEQRQVFTAQGNVLMRFRGAELRSEDLQVNLVTRLAVAEGNVSLISGEQVLFGSRFEYNFVQETGTIQQARGQIFIPTAGTDFALPAPESPTTPIPRGTASDIILANQPPQRVTAAEGITIGGGGGALLPQPRGTVRRVRFEAERVNFYPEGWTAANVRITNDPFSPPELEVRAERATLTRVSPLRDEVVATRPRVVFDQRLSLPILRDRVVIDRTERDPAIARLGFDDADRGGLFVERTFEPLATRRTQLRITPQLLLQQAVRNGFNFADPSSYGLRASLTSDLGPNTQLRGALNFNSLDFSRNDILRANLRLTQAIGDHALTTEYAYRERFFNGSLGYQRVQNSFGTVLTSPVYRLGNTGINLNYQAGAQYVRARTDRRDLIESPFVGEDDVSLGRFQASATLSRNFTLWRGQGLPATPTEGLRYTPVPVVPYLRLVTAAIGTTNAYSNGDRQSSLTGTIGLRGQFGNFSRPWFDYTGFGLLYSQTALNGESPFKFDRLVDVRVLTAELTQQIYGPFRVGLRTSINLDNGDRISTDVSVEYSRRTYGLILRYNPQLGLAAFNIRISDFNWTGGNEPFTGSGVRPVEGGVIRPN
ncbi:MAG: DUF3769 domain-containing protein [Desertifilum sp.]|nr:DUF3769 domain-containing protein [Desertifilum sp.]